jgi:tryptophan 2,3-dioxygenase
MQTEPRTASTTVPSLGIQPGLLRLIMQPAPANRDDQVAAVTAVEHWLLSRDAEDFPYGAVVTAFNRVGKHFVPATLLDALARARASLPVAHGSEPSVRLLDQFLDIVLDKLDGRYANPTYLGLSLLPLASVDDATDDLAAVQRQYDRLFLQLITDAARFEIAAAEGTTALLPQMRPDVRTTAKRCRLVLQLAGPAARRLNLGDELDVANPVAGARQLWSQVAATLTPAERRTLRLTMLPVSLVHDEYQFIRILQSFEATFALMAVYLQAAVQALMAGDAGLARQGILAAASALHDAAPLFSLVATMQLEAFQTFREFTEGASAIQSRNCKLVESLCRKPDASRLDSPAYLSVPEVRQRVLAGQLTLDHALTAARHAGLLSAQDIDDLEQAMLQFAGTLLKWRRTHHRIAVRMLGENTGTGYTAGAAYLKSVQEIPVFSSVHMAEADGATTGRGTARHEEIAGARSEHPNGARGRCPFSGRAAS